MPIPGGLPAMPAAGGCWVASSGTAAGGTGIPRQPLYQRIRCSAECPALGPGCVQAPTWRGAAAVGWAGTKGGVVVRRAGAIHVPAGGAARVAHALQRHGDEAGGQGGRAAIWEHCGGGRAWQGAARGGQAQSVQALCPRHGGDRMAAHGAWAGVGKETSWRWRGTCGSCAGRHQCRNRQHRTSGRGMIPRPPRSCPTPYTALRCTQRPASHLRAARLRAPRVPRAQVVRRGCRGTQRGGGEGGGGRPGSRAGQPSRTPAPCLHSHGRA